MLLHRLGNDGERRAGLLGTTPGEIKQRTERMHHFNSLNEVENILTWDIDFGFTTNRTVDPITFVMRYPPFSRVRSRRLPC
ncbi:MAG: hypothetical protein OSA48_12005 [Akkermansiaceae bacterium]|nr:hypothetical protein [Akkermansiaceae bacterium]